MPIYSPRRLFLLICLCCLFSLPALAVPPLVAVSIPPQKFLVETIAGDRVAILTLVKPGSDPHTYEPSPSQIKDCTSAAMYLSIGVPFEDVWLPRLREVMPKLPVYSILGDIKRFPLSGNSPQTNLAHGNDSGTTDPHVWTTPANLIILARETEKRLTALLPEEKDFFQANTRQLEDRLKELDASLTKQLAGLTENQRMFMTFHPSWAYFARQYGLQELALESEGKEPSARAMKEYIDFAREHGLRLVLVAPQFPQTAATTLAANTGAQVAAIDPLAENCIRMLADMGDILVRQSVSPK